MDASSGTGREDAAARSATGAGAILSAATLLFWLPGLAGPPGSAPTAWAPVLRLASTALQQYPPRAAWAVPLLACLFSVAGGVGLGAASRSRRAPAVARAWLRGALYTQLALYGSTALALGLAVFSAFPAWSGPWRAAALAWLLNVALLPVLLRLSRALPSDPHAEPPLLAVAEDEREEPEEDEYEEDESDLAAEPADELRLR